MDFYHCEMCNIQRLYIVDSPDIFCCKSLFTAGWSKKWHGTQKFSVFHFRIHTNLINYIGYDKWAPTNCTKTLFCVRTTVRKRVWAMNISEIKSIDASVHKTKLKSLSISPNQLVTETMYKQKQTFLLLMVN